jgi:glycosyltransferase involved in cell wall biosynthesis
MADYDQILFTPGPSFYKNNLFNEIAKKQRIFVFYTGMDINERNADFYKGDLLFDHAFLPRNVFRLWHNLFGFLHRNHYRQMVVSGWNSPASFFAVILSRKEKNACIVESTIYESQTRGLRNFLKRFLVSRLSMAYVSGLPHERLIRALGFKGEVKRFGGCGLLNYIKQPSYSPRSEVKNFIFVGRLVPVKNLELLIEVFNEFPQYNLSIIGFGPLEEPLKKMAHPNVRFYGAIDNTELPRYYQEADVFLLCSYSETWGLVVEESLNNGTPVIVSDCVGCNEDLVNDQTGIVFHSNDKQSLKDAIVRITDVEYYNRLRQGVARLDFQKRAKQQVDSFLLK